MKHHIGRIALFVGILWVAAPQVTFAQTPRLGFFKSLDFRGKLLGLQHRYSACGKATACQSCGPKRTCCYSRLHYCVPNFYVLRAYKEKPFYAQFAPRYVRPKTEGEPAIPMNGMAGFSSGPQPPLPEILPGPTPIQRLGHTAPQSRQPSGVLVPTSLESQK
ncbi:MAG: hypothetical protein ACFCD0_05345 [Gemmataceae bacterium]